MIFKCNLDDFCEEIFHEMESIQDGNRAHIVEFNADTKEEAADKILMKLKSFMANQLNKK